MGIKDGSGLEKSGATLKNECRPVFLFQKKWKPSANGCKPNSVIAQGKPEATDIHLSAPPKPTTPPCGTRHTRCSLSDEQPCIIHCLAPSRVFHTRGDCSRGGGLLPPLFTLARRRFVFCGTFHTRGFSPRVPIFQSGLCSVVSGLSSRRNLGKRISAVCGKLLKNLCGSAIWLRSPRPRCGFPRSEFSHRSYFSKIKAFFATKFARICQKKFRVSTKKLDRNAIFTMIRNYYGRQKRKK